MGCKKLTTRDITICAINVAVITVCAWISIPSAVPFTLQTFAVFFTAGMFGCKRATISLILYVLLGMIGVPVFAGFGSGIGCVFGPTGGYIIGFVINAFVTGIIVDICGRKIWVMVLAMVAGLLACYTLGTIWFVYVYSAANGPVTFGIALSWCVIPFIIPDCLKMILSVVIIKRLEPYKKLYQ